AFDNESPRHRVFVEDFALGARLVTCGAYLAFIGDGGYWRPELWLSGGWAALLRGQWETPLVWERGRGEWLQFRLGRLRRGGAGQRTAATPWPRRTPAGPDGGCPPSPSGRWLPVRSPSKGA